MRNRTNVGGGGLGGRGEGGGGPGLGGKGGGCGSTLTVTVAVTRGLPSESATEYVKATVPTKVPTDVYMICPEAGSINAVPDEGCCAMEATASPVPTSFEREGMATVAPWSTLAVSLHATAAGENDAASKKLPPAANGPDWFTLVKAQRVTN